MNIAAVIINHVISCLGNAVASTKINITNCADAFIRSNAVAIDIEKSHSNGVAAVASAQAAVASASSKSLQADADYTTACNAYQVKAARAILMILALKFITFAVGIAVCIIFGICGNKWVEAYFIKNGFKVIGATWAKNKKEAVFNINFKAQQSAEATEIAS
jgi:hypothetical protein